MVLRAGSDAQGREELLRHAHALHRRRTVYAVVRGGRRGRLEFRRQGPLDQPGRPFLLAHGLGASPVLYRKLLIMPYDGSNRVASAGQWPNNSPRNNSAGGRPGTRPRSRPSTWPREKTRVTGKRGQSRIAHATPILLDQGGKTQMISIAGDAVQGFDPDSGERLWSAYCQGEGLVPNPGLPGRDDLHLSGYEKTTLRGNPTGRDRATSPPATSPGSRRRECRRSPR
jgi:hypothetical protein